MARKSQGKWVDKRRKKGMGVLWLKVAIATTGFHVSLHYWRKKEGNDLSPYLGSISFLFVFFAFFPFMF